MDPAHATDSGKESIASRDTGKRAGLPAASTCGTKQNQEADVQGRHGQDRQTSSTRLMPIVRVSRDKIPLAWLDTAHAFQDLTNDANGARTFTNYSETLANWFRGSDKGSKTVQIVRDKSSGRLCAVERVRYGDYAICALGSWVPEHLVIGQQQSSTQQAIQLGTSEPAPRVLDTRKARKQAIDLDRWWEKTAAPDTQSAATNSPTLHFSETTEERNKPVQSEQSAEAVPHASRTSQSSPHRLHTIANPSPLATGDPVSAATPESNWERFINHYMDALYIQKTSLAFFTKGPLARLRTTLQSEPNERSEPSSVVGLSDSLRAIVVALPVMDRKYKETLPTIANDTAIGADTEELLKRNTKRKRKSLRIKLGKDGLLNSEEQYVRKWWSAGPSEVQSSTETRDQQVRRRLDLLRVRETLLQIIVVLEILSLESSTRVQNRGDHADSTRAITSHSAVSEQQLSAPVEIQTAPMKRRKSSQPHDLNLHLDLLVDRIAIWHSLKQESGFMQQELSKQQGSLKSWAVDILGSFCIDVIVPFFKHRVPDTVSMMVKKLGMASKSPEKQNKRKANDGLDTRLLHKPSSPNDQPGQRRNLHRVPTDSEATLHAKKVPGLVRAATDTSLLSATSLKRESSEGPLSAIPLQRQRKAPRKDSAEKLRLLQKRTVSFSALSASKKRKAAAEEEVKAAIESIKRPNRGEVSREVADERDRRVSTATKTRGARKVLVSRNNIQVAATPKAQRKVDIFATSDPTTQPASIGIEPLPSNVSSHASSRILDTIQATKAYDAIIETPTANRIKPLNLNANVRTASLPSARDSTKDVAWSASASEDRRSESVALRVFATPLKKPAPPDASTQNDCSIALGCDKRLTTMPNVDRHCTAGTSPSEQLVPLQQTSAVSGNIYASLGWDDYPIDE